MNLETAAIWHCSTRHMAPANYLANYLLPEDNTAWLEMLISPGLAAYWRRANEVYAQAGSHFPVKEPVLVYISSLNSRPDWKSVAQKPAAQSHPVMLDLQVPPANGLLHSHWRMKKIFLTCDYQANMLRLQSCKEKKGPANINTRVWFWADLDYPLTS